MAKIFIDTNILVYAVDARDVAKQLKAADCIRERLAEASGCLSTQVLQEFASVALLKLKQPETEVLRGLKYFESLEIVTITPHLVQRGVILAGKYQLHFWDATILAAAEEAGCDVLYSEDFPAGTNYGKLRVENPLL